MAFRREMNDGIRMRRKAIYERSVTDVANHKLHTILGHVGDILRVAGIRELIEHRHAHVRLLAHHPAHEIRSDEPAPAGDDDVTRFKAGHHDPSHHTPGSR